MPQDQGVTPSGPGLRPFGVEPQASQAKPLVPNAAKLAEKRAYERGYRAAKRGSRTSEAVEAEQAIAWVPPPPIKWRSYMMIDSNGKETVGVDGKVKFRSELLQIVAALERHAKAMETRGTGV